MIIAMLFTIGNFGISLGALQQVDKENVVFIYNGVLFSHEEWYYVICRKISQTEKDKYSMGRF
jgi:hypothetical protein